MAREESHTTPTVRGIRRTKACERARDRVLGDHERRLFWQATGDVTTYDDFGLWSMPNEAREKSKCIGRDRFWCPP
jgi:hypothetical protein